MANIYSGYNNYGSNLARKKQRRFFIKLSLIFLAIVISGGTAGYLIFISPWMRITDTSINGLESITSADISPLIDSAKEEGRQNMIFLDTEMLRSNILSNFPVIEEVEVKKEYTHKLIIDIKERTPVGTLCDITSCRYFDNSGILWGKALKSSGSLLLSIDDLRVSEEKKDRIEDSFLTPIKQALSGLGESGVKIKRVSIPAESIGDFRIYTIGGYYIIFDSGLSINNQIKTLKIFLDEKGANFTGEYIDLRIEDRIYYK